MSFIFISVAHCPANVKNSANNNKTLVSNIPIIFFKNIKSFKFGNKTITNNAQTSKINVIACSYSILLCKSTTAIETLNISADNVNAKFVSSVIPTIPIIYINNMIIKTIIIDSLYLFFIAYAPP